VDKRVRTNRQLGGRNWFTWGEYDVLPAAVRRVLMFACCDLGSHRAAMNLLAGKSIAEVCAIERGVDLGLTRLDVLDDYGPDHPFLSKVRAA
jgi:hypothetical protein